MHESIIDLRSLTEWEIDMNKPMDELMCKVLEAMELLQEGG